MESNRSHGFLFVGQTQENTLSTGLNVVDKVVLSGARKEHEQLQIALAHEWVRVAHILEDRREGVFEFFDT